MKRTQNCGAEIGAAEIGARSYRANQSILFLQLCIVATLLAGYVVIDIILYFYIPIENALDDAANHFVSVYHTTIIFFTATVAYFIVQKTSRSSINIFTRALDSFFYKDGKDERLDITIDQWKKLNNQEKDIEVAKAILKSTKYTKPKIGSNFSPFCIFLVVICTVIIFT